MVELSCISRTSDSPRSEKTRKQRSGAPRQSHLRLLFSPVRKHDFCCDALAALEARESWTSPTHPRFGRNRLRLASSGLLLVYAAASSALRLIQRPASQPCTSHRSHTRSRRSYTPPRLAWTRVVAYDKHETLLGSPRHSCDCFSSIGRTRCAPPAALGPHL